MSPKYKPAKPEGDLFFVRVRNPLDTRRELLLASKDSLNLMRKVELMGNLRKQKEKLWADLHHVFEQLIVLNRRLRSAMPKAAIPEPEAPVPVEEHVEHEVHVEALKERTKLQLLEEELSAIENKLTALG